MGLIILYHTLESVSTFGIFDEMKFLCVRVKAGDPPLSCGMTKNAVYYINIGMEALCFLGYEKI